MMAAARTVEASEKIETQQQSESRSKRTASGAIKSIEHEAQVSILLKIFSGIDQALTIMEKRNRSHRGSLVELRKDVGAITGRELTDERLGQVLDLAGDMLKASYVGEGKAATLVLEQKANDGLRAPTPAEQYLRQERFIQACTSALSKGHGLPEGRLPPVPTSTLKALAPAAPLAPAAASYSSGLGQGAPNQETIRSAGKRLEALRRRVAAREAVAEAKSAWEASLARLQQRLGICQDAVTAVGILDQMFSRTQLSENTDITAFTQNRDRKHVGATQREVIQALCSASMGTQTHRPLSLEAAEAAFACLAAHAGSWFRVEVSQHSQRAGALLQRLPKGASSAALDALTTEMRALAEQHAALLERGPDHDGSASQATKVSAAEKVIAAPGVESAEVQPSPQCLKSAANNSSRAKPSTAPTPAATPAELHSRAGDDTVKPVKRMRITGKRTGA